ncbi:hypothetical protein HanPSC8_Chr01g0035831 [Helianthus annuus]|nr:hypothetical protein HanPSC8_Chr01g0035831 [Helianthus annuus]
MQELDMCIFNITKNSIGGYSSFSSTINSFFSATAATGVQCHHQLHHQLQYPRHQLALR